MKDTFRKSMRWFHNSMGLVFGWLLFFIFLTGTLGYFDSEIDRWMRPELPMKYEQFSEKELAKIAIKHLNNEAPNATKWQIYFPNQREDVLRIKWNEPKVNSKSTSFRPPHGKEKSYEKFIDPIKNEVIEVRETGGGQLLYKMHYLLHYVSPTVGQIIVGFAAIAMLIALITGVIVHANIFKDYFTFKQDASTKSWLNGHLIAGVAALPYHIMITYSGLIFFMFTYVTLVPLANYGKDMRVMIKDAFPSQKSVKINNVKTSIINIEPIVDDSKKEFEYIKSIMIVNPYDTSMEVLVKREYTTLLRGNSIDKLYYDGIEGKRIDKPLLDKPSGNTFRSILTGLHTALFADIYFRWVFFFMGILGTYMIASGLVLWTKKRKNKKDTLSYKLVDSLNAATIVGLCSAIGAYFIANRIIPIGIEDRIAYEINSLFLVWLFTFIVALKSEYLNRWKIQFYIAGYIFLLIPVLNFFYTSKNIFATIWHGDITLVVVDLLFIFVGLLFIYLAKEQGKKHAFI